MNNYWSRRKFIVKGSKSLALVFGILTFGKYASIAKIHTNKSVLVSNPIKKILVAYESQFNSTKEVADVIGQELSQNGFQVTIKKIKDVSNLSDYDKVVLGSAIQYDKWMAETIFFVKENKEILAKMPVSCFFVCLVLAKGKEKSKKKTDGYALKIKELVPSVDVKSIGQFAGVLDYSKMSFGQRFAAKALFAIIGIKEGDYRDWNEIRAWAKEIF